MGKRGFTLIELLVVIAIVAILAAILFPVMTAAKLKANQSKCMNNMHQVGTAITMYADRNEGVYPFAWNKSNWNIWHIDTWRERIQPYLKSRNSLLCPVKTKAPPDKEIAKISGHYGMNVYVTMNDAATSYVGWRSVSSVPMPTRTILISENKDGDWSAEPWDNNSTGDAGQFWPYHGDSDTKGGIFAFCDGHAKFMSVETTQKAVGTVRFYFWKVRKY